MGFIQNLLDTRGFGLKRKLAQSETDMLLELKQYVTFTFDMELSKHSKISIKTSGLSSPGSVIYVPVPLQE